MWGFGSGGLIAWVRVSSPLWNLFILSFRKIHGFVYLRVADCGTECPSHTRSSELSLLQLGVP